MRQVVHTGREQHEWMTHLGKAEGGTSEKQVRQLPRVVAVSIFRSTFSNLAEKR